jgi:hypothetical protein
MRDFVEVMRSEQAPLRERDGQAEVSAVSVETWWVLCLRLLYSASIRPPNVKTTCPLLAAVWILCPLLNSTSYD